MHICLFHVNFPGLSFPVIFPNKMTPLIAGASLGCGAPMYLLLEQCVC